MIAKKEICAKDLMKSKLITLHPNDKMEKVKEIFETYSIRHLPVLVADRVVGLISKTDFLRVEGMARDSFDAFLTEKIMEVHLVDQYMTSDIICCKADTSLSKIIDVFLENEIHSLLVVEDGSLLGIITPQDILRLMKSELDHE